MYKDDCLKKQPNFPTHLWYGVTCQVNDQGKLNPSLNIQCTSVHWNFGHFSYSINRKESLVMIMMSFFRMILHLATGTEQRVLKWPSNFQLKGHAGAFSCRFSLPFNLSWSCGLWSNEDFPFILPWCGIMLHTLDYWFNFWGLFVGIYSSVAWPRTYTTYTTVSLLLVWILPE